MPKRLGNDFNQLGDQIAQQQAAKWKMFLAMLPGLIIFLIAGAQPTTAMIGGFGIAALIMPAIIGRPSDATERYQRTPLLMGAALLAYAAGIQVMTYRLGLNADQAEAFAMTAFYTLLIGAMAVIMPFGLWKMTSDLRQVLRGEKPIDGDAILMHSGAAGLLAAIPPFVLLLLLQWATSAAWLEWLILPACLGTWIGIAISPIAV
jgi:hypothetical protein